MSGGKLQKILSQATEDGKERLLTAIWNPAMENEFWKKSEYILPETFLKNDIEKEDMEVRLCFFSIWKVKNWRQCSRFSKHTLHLYIGPEKNVNTNHKHCMDKALTKNFVSVCNNYRNIQRSLLRNGKRSRSVFDANMQGLLQAERHSLQKI